jgi:tRNA A-37 threonylcarbamoyl transferase component Bud32
LGFISNEIEPKAVDYLSMKNQIPYKDEFEKGYKSAFSNFDLVFQKTKKIEDRVRYSQ